MQSHKELLLAKSFTDTLQNQTPYGLVAYTPKTTQSPATQRATETTEDPPELVSRNSRTSHSLRPNLCLPTHGQALNRHIT